MNWRFLFLFVLLFIFGCQRDHISGPVTYVLPWPNPQGDYHLQEVEIKTLNFADRLEGSAAQVYVSSGMTDSGQFMGEIARPRLTPMGKRRFMAADFESALAIAVYAHFEKLQELDRELGVETLLSWPRRVGIQMKVALGGGFYMHNNAMYLPEWDATLVAPSFSNGMPMAMSGGVIAHEHFHALFHAGLGPEIGGMVSGLNTQKSNRHRPQDLSKSTGENGREEQLENVTPIETSFYILRGWNEGLADFWGYLYTGDPAFYRKTFTTRYLHRLLDTEPFFLPSIAGFRQEIAKWKTTPCQESDCGGFNFYGLGTRLGRVLTQATARMAGKGSALSYSAPKEQRVVMARQILNALPWLRKKLLSLSTNDSLKPDEILQGIFPREKPIAPNICRLLRSAVDSSTWDYFGSSCSKDQLEEKH